MSTELLTPKFLTKEVARQAVNFVLSSVFGTIGRRPPSRPEILAPKRDQCHVVIIVPGIVPGVRDGRSDHPDYPIQPVVLYEWSEGEVQKFEHPYDDIARSKAQQLWDGTNEGGTDCEPHLLFPGDTPYWGGVKRERIVVACSGVQPWIDRMISGMIADALIAMAYGEWMASEDKKNGVSFLS